MVHAIEQIGSFAGLAAFLGLGLFALLSFAHGRDIRRLREWAGSAPEREADRKEQTATIAAQRAEELRALEESRTAERDAIADREERRARREEGLPEESRGERAAAAFSSFGHTISQPRWLAGIFVVLVLIAGGIAYAVLSGGDSSSAVGKGDSKTAAGQTKPAEVKVAVLNGTATDGLAETFGAKLQRKGYELGAITNTPGEFETSVVTFVSGHKPEAKAVAKQLQIGKLEAMDEEIGAVAEGANVAVIVGEDNAAAAN